jgi:hypothetical protein
MFDNFADEPLLLGLNLPKKLFFSLDLILVLPLEGFYLQITFMNE